VKIFACPDTELFPARCRNREEHSPFATLTSCSCLKRVGAVYISAFGRARAAGFGFRSWFDEIKKFALSRFRFQTQMAQMPMLRAEVYARALRASHNAKRAEVLVVARCA
jgi:hypothetical protein